MIKGQITGVGVGPGDPDLITLKAMKAIQKADIIAYPAPDNGVSFARQIIEKNIPLHSGQSEYKITIPMRIERFPAQEIYDQAANDLAAHMEEGKNIVVLCEGDPFFYGSFMYLHERLYKKFRSTIIPGVSSVMALASVTQSPLCERNELLTIIPGPLDEDLMTAQLQEEKTAYVIMKVGRHIEKIKRCLIATNRLDKAIYVERASLPNQKILPLSAVDEGNAPYFSIIQVRI